ncbi:MAG: STAS domain-containing protein, partial [Rhizobiaceae bacterium]
TALAALVIFVMLELSDIRYFINLWRIRKLEFAVAILAFAGVLAYGVLEGVMIGVGLSLVLLAEHISRPPLEIIGRTKSGTLLPSDKSGEVPGLFILRMYGPLVFLNARRLARTIQSEIAKRPDTKVVLLDASATTGADTTGTLTYIKLRDVLAEKSIDFWVAGVRDDIWSRIVKTIETSNAEIPPRFASVEEAYGEFLKTESETAKSG